MQLNAEQALVDAYIRDYDEYLALDIAYCHS